MEGLAHAGGLRQFVRFAAAQSLDLESILDRELLEIVRAVDEVEYVPAHALIDILQITAALRRRPDLGVSYGAASRLKNLGPLSLIWDHAPDVYEACRVSRRFLHLETAALAASYEVQDDEIVVANHLLIPARYGASHYMDSTLAVTLLLVRQILARDWSPRRVEFVGPAPATLKYHKAIFRCPLEFGAERYALVFEREDVFRPAPNANIHMFNYLERHLESLDSPSPRAVAERVERVIASSLTTGGANLGHLARELGVSPRGLQRRLNAEGASFTEILQRTRARVAQVYLRSAGSPNLDRAAHLLGFADADGAGRFLRLALGEGVRSRRTRV